MKNRSSIVTPPITISHRVPNFSLQSVHRFANSLISSFHRHRIGILWQLQGRFSNCDEIRFSGGKREESDRTNFIEPDMTSEGIKDQIIGQI